jgi:hypothetical protein
LKEDIKNSGVNNAMEYIEKELKGLKLDAEQKELLKKCVSEEGSGSNESYK